MNRSEFERGLQELRNEYQRQVILEHCYQVKDSSKCMHCNYCEKCDNCYRCTFCKNCSRCVLCTHCQRCESCFGSSYLIDSVDCHDCTHAELCTGCVNCTYCYGCTGLTNQEFYILNQPYTREEYFKLVKALKQ